MVARKLLLRYITVHEGERLNIFHYDFIQQGQQHTYLHILKELNYIIIKTQ